MMIVFEINGEEYRAYPNEVEKGSPKTWKIVRVKEEITGVDWTSNKLKEKLSNLQKSKEGISDEIEVTEYLISKVEEFEKEGVDGLKD